MPRPRLTIRRLMLVVAIAALLMYAALLTRRSLDRNSAALRFAARERLARDDLAKIEGWSKSQGESIRRLVGMTLRYDFDGRDGRSDVLPKLLDGERKVLRTLEKHRSQKRSEVARDAERSKRYALAARYPWLPVPPDPPEPK